MRTKTNAEKGKSPYVKYNKRPYVYQFKTCSHRRHDGRPNAVQQSVVGVDRAGNPVHWRGFACGACNIILKS